MSFDAVYHVTRALRMLLHNELVTVSASAVVTLNPPGETLPAASGVNLYLYRVQESPFTKNLSWPGDRKTAASDQPALGLQLFYLLTPLGTKPDEGSFQLGDDAHTMLGVAMSTLHENPILNHVHIPATAASPGFDADAILPDFLLDSYEQIKVVLTPAGLEELSKIWATINQPYRLSVAYEVSLVELTPTAPPLASGGIVTRAPTVNVIEWQAAQLTSLAPPRGALVHIDGAGRLIGNSIVINGSGLTLPGQPPVVTVGGQSVTVSAQTLLPDETLTATLPANLDAGPEEDVVVSLSGRRSRPLTFSVDPWLSSVTPIRTALDPAAPNDLTLVLRGSGFTTSPAAVRLQSAAGVTTVTTFAAGATDTAVTVALPTDLSNGSYQVRLVLDDTASSATNSHTTEVMPLIASSGAAVQTVGGHNVHQLSINGARLNGADLRLVIDGIVFRAGANANAEQLVFTLGKLLDQGTHALRVVVDGHASRHVAFEI